jgi:hypothetical protein
MKRWSGHRLLCLNWRMRRACARSSRHALVLAMAACPGDVCARLSSASSLIGRARAMSTRSTFLRGQRQQVVDAIRWGCSREVAPVYARSLNDVG